MATPRAVPKGGAIHGGNIRRIDNAPVERVSVQNAQTGCVLVSHDERGPRNLTRSRQLWLGVNRNTVITDASGRAACLCDIRPGMRIDAEFYSAAAAGFPPRAAALRIAVRQNDGHARRPGTRTTTDRIARVDARDGYIVTGAPDDINRQMRFNVSEDTAIFNPNGRRIALRDLIPGQWVRVTHADFQTMSLPSQSPAYRIQIR